MQARVEELTQTLQRERNEAERERAALDRQCHNLLAENGELRSKVNSVASELEYVSGQHSNAKSDIEQLQRQHGNSLEDAQIKTQSLESEHKRTLDQFRDTIGQKETAINRLEEEIYNLRKDLHNKNEAAEYDICNLEQTLSSTRGMLDMQQEESAKLKLAHADAANENRALRSQTNMLELDLSRSQREVEALRTENSRLEALLYGR